jgi:hypothetical protein
LLELVVSDVLGHRSLPDSGSLPRVWDTRQSPNYTRQRALGSEYSGKDVFAECFLSGTRQWEGTRQRKVAVTAFWGHDGVFAECPRDGTRQRLGSLPSALWLALGKVQVTLPSACYVALGKVQVTLRASLAFSL